MTNTVTYQNDIYREKMKSWQFNNLEQAQKQLAKLKAEFIEECDFMEFMDIIDDDASNYVACDGEDEVNIHVLANL